MAANTIERTLRRMLSTKERLSISDALRLRMLILEDGYLSKSEKKIVQETIRNDLLSDAALDIFHDLLHEKDNRESSSQAVA